MRRAVLILGTLAVVAACGDSTGPGTYPEVAGTYDYSATLDGVPGSPISGSLIIADDSRETPGFTGSFSVSVTGGTPLSGALVEARVNAGREVQFDFGSGSYRHTGVIDGRRITGTWVIYGAGSPLDGTFTATRR